MPSLVLFGSPSEASWPPKFAVGVGVGGVKEGRGRGDVASPGISHGKGLPPLGFPESNSGIPFKFSDGVGAGFGAKKGGFGGESGAEDGSRRIGGSTRNGI